MKILIIPDVHGRKFWEQAKALINDVDKIIFLGDYVDPYDFEWITKEDAINTLTEIIAFAKQNRDKVVLLLGNHCLHYIYDAFKQKASGGRVDKKNYEIIKHLYLDNIELFKLAYEINDGGKQYLFSHAGVCKSWYEKYQSIIGDLNANNLNTLFTTNEGIDSLCDIGRSRWGKSKVGSIVWADVDDHEQETFDNIYQIFGHTQQVESEKITSKYACLDVRKCFLLENNTIKNID